jgi:hypothetical protein
MLVWVELGAFVLATRDYGEKIAYLRAIPTFNFSSHLIFLGEHPPFQY